MAPARAECARSLVSVLKASESEEVALSRITDARLWAASAAGKSWWTKYPRSQIAPKLEQADYRFDEPATGSGQSHAVLRSEAEGSAAAGSMEEEPATECEPFLSLVGQVRPLLSEKLNQKSPTCHYPILEPRKI